MSAQNQSRKKVPKIENIDMLCVKLYFIVNKNSYTENSSTKNMHKIYPYEKIELYRSKNVCELYEITVSNFGTNNYTNKWAKIGMLLVTEDIELKFYYYI